MSVLLTSCQRVTMFLLNVFCSLTCNVHGALHAIFLFFVFCSVDFLLFCLCFVYMWFVCFLCMDPSGLIQNKWNGMEYRITAEASDALNTLVSGKEESLQS